MHDAFLILTFIRYAHSKKIGQPNNLKLFETKERNIPKQDSQITYDWWRRTLVLIYAREHLMIIKNGQSRETGNIQDTGLRKTKQTKIQHHIHHLNDEQHGPHQKQRWTHMLGKVSTSCSLRDTNIHRKVNNTSRHDLSYK